VGAGMLLRCATAPLRSHEMARCAALSDDLEPGDVVMGDRGLSSYAHLAILVIRGLHGLFRAHQRQIVDFTPGRPRAGTREFDSPAGLPRSRWIKAQGDSDQIVVWYKPRSKPVWMAAAGDAARPAGRR